MLKLLRLIEDHLEWEDVLAYIDTLLGGGYKDLMHESAGETSRDYLDQAIAAYERGMTLDLNDYYPASTCPGSTGCAAAGATRSGRPRSRRSSWPRVRPGSSTGPGTIGPCPPGWGRRSTRGTWNWRAIWWHRSADGA